MEGCKGVFDCAMAAHVRVCGYRTFTDFEEFRFKRHLLQRIPDVGVVDTQVFLGRRDRLMSQHLLDGENITGAIVEALCEDFSEVMCGEVSVVPTASDTIS